MKKAAVILGLFSAIILMVLATFLYIAPHAGWRVGVILTNSMEPGLSIGSLIITRSAEPETIGIGDIFTFQPKSPDDIPVTHRGVGIESNSPLRFLTKGDADTDLDTFKVPARNLIGKVYFDTPHWGYFTEFLKTPWGFVFGLAIPGLVLLTAYAVSLSGAISDRGKLNK